MTRLYRSLGERVVQEKIVEWRRKRLGEMIQDRTRETMSVVDSFWVVVAILCVLDGKLNVGLGDARRP